MLQKQWKRTASYTVCKWSVSYNIYLFNNQFDILLRYLLFKRGMGHQLISRLRLYLWKNRSPSFFQAIFLFYTFLLRMSWILLSLAASLITQRLHHQLNQIGRA